MTVPKTKYIFDDEGNKKLVQLSVQDWENFVNEFRKLQNLTKMKKKLKNAFIEIKKIEKGEIQGTTLNEFLNEL
jgi:hypothetical protein